MPANTKEVQLDLSFASRLNALKKPLHATQGVHHLMCVLNLYAGPNRDFCWPSLKTLALVMDVTERQVRRLIAKAVELELLFEIVETQDGRKSRRFKIRQANMIERAQRIEKEKPQRPRRRRPKRTSRHAAYDNVSQSSDTLSRISDKVSQVSDTLSESSDNVSKPHCLYEFESTKKVQKESSPPPPLTGWKEVEGVIVGFPVSEWRVALTAARAAGCDPAHVLAIVAEAQRRRRGWEKPEGVLYHRLLNAHPSRSPSEGWPGEHEAAKARQRMEAEASRRSTAEAEEAARQVQRDAERRRRDELEAEFGLDLDTMPDAERDELVHEAIGANRIAWAKWREAPDISAEIFRGPVLRYMATRKASEVRGF